MLTVPERAKIRIEREKKEQLKKKFDLPPGYELPSGKTVPGRKPGTLLLNMLIKNERDHLDRTLPKWAKIIDYWIIGVDDNNTDDSAAVIHKHLSHIPGEIVIVHFDGMGPTWSELVKVGIEKYPKATHGIIADADFMPMKDTLNKMELDVRCSKHMYTIWTQDHKNERKMDWIYRNIPGAVVRRRTHQILEVPELPDQEVFQTLIDLPVEEREGGFGDREGKKNEKYIIWLEKDLLEYPNDTRTLYYLGYAHYDLFNLNQKNPKPEHWDHLAKGVEYFKQRMALDDKGNEEELWFAILKLGEIYERFYNDWQQSEYYYKYCTELDPYRADAWFYIGQHYRLRGEPEKAISYLKTAATVAIPERSLFQWHYLYFCLSKLEYARAVIAAKDVTRKEFKAAKKILDKADCRNGDPGNLGELKSLKDVIARKLVKTIKPGQDPKEAVVKRLNTLMVKHGDELEQQLKSRFKGDTEEFGVELETRRPSYYEVISALTDQVKEYLTDATESGASCKLYRKATKNYNRFMKSHQEEIFKLVSRRSTTKEWDEVNALIATTCR